MGGWGCWRVRGPAGGPALPCLTRSRCTWTWRNHRSLDLSRLKIRRGQVLLFIHSSRCAVSFTAVAHVKFKVNQNLLLTFRDTGYKLPYVTDQISKTIYVSHFFEMVVIKK